MKRAPRLMITTALVAAMTATAIPQAAFAASTEELTFWRSAERSGDVNDYRAYLRQYPDGDFVDLARNRIAAADAASTPAPVYQSTDSAADVEDDLSLTYNDKIRIQTELNDLGYDTRGVDGIFGPGTRGSIRGWQSEIGDAPTGYLTEAQADRLLDSADEREFTSSGQADYAAQVAARRDDRQAIRAERREQRRAEENALNLNVAQRTEVEQRLAIAGHQPGPVDGDFTRQTRLAIADFREREGLERSRFLDRPMLVRLVEKSDAVANASGQTGASSGGSIDPGVAAAIGLGALAIGGAYLLTRDDDDDDNRDRVRRGDRRQEREAERRRQRSMNATDKRD